MKPLKHFNARTIEDAALAANEKYKIIAGGTDCLSLLKNGVLPVYPEVLVNMKTVAGLAYIEEDAEGLRIGALAKLADIAGSPLVRERYNLFADAAKSIASPQIRNMATLGGNLCQDTRCWYYRCPSVAGEDYRCYRKGGRVCFAVAGDNRYHAILGGKGCFAVCPSDTAIALTALDAEIMVQGLGGERLIPIKDFYLIMGTVLKPGEIVTGVRIPKPPAGNKQRFIKFRLGKAVDFAIGSVASVITMVDGICREAGIALGAVAPAPVRAMAAEDAIKGKAVNATTAGEAATAAVAGSVPLSMNAYKVEIAKALVIKAILT